MIVASVVAVNFTKLQLETRPTEARVSFEVEDGDKGDLEKEKALWGGP